MLPLTHAPAAVHGEHLAGDELRFVAHEEDGGGIQIAGLANAPAVERLFGLDELLNRLIALRALRHGRGHERGGEDVAANVLRRIMGGGGGGQSDDGGLGRRVGVGGEKFW